MRELSGSRVLVVGASSGIGRCAALDLAKRGVRLALTARRADRIAAAAEDCGPETIGIVADVRRPEDCARLVEEAAAALGGLDGLVYCPGVAHLAPLVDVDAELWGELFETNVIGAALVTRAAVPHLEASGGRAVYLSSESASSTPPWPGLGAYITTKAALDKLIEVWHAEHPAIVFTRLVVGATRGGEGDGSTGFARDWDPELLASTLEEWLNRGYMTGSLVDVDEITATVAHVLSSQAVIGSIDVRPRRDGTG
jgi:NAD(P)-dependent dehydrogenase (short-subunit alcohol dehydrogenase family)